MTYDRSWTRQHAQVTDEAIAALRERIGVEVPELEPANEYATKDAIRRYALGIGDTNPLWLKEEYAQKTHWGGIIAPPTFVGRMGISNVKELSRNGKPLTAEERARGRGWTGIHGWASGNEIEYFQPIHVGDRLTVKTFLKDVIVKRSEFAGRTVHRITETQHWNQDGIMVAINRGLVISGGREQTAGQRKKYADLERARYTDDDINRIEADYEKEIVRGSTPRYWEDVQEGEEITPVVKGPLTVTDCIAYKIGTGNFGFITGAHRAAYENRKRHPAAWPVNEYGVPDVVERVHWEDALAIRTGNPLGAYDYGAQRICWLHHLMTNWVGDDGFLRKLSGQLRAFNYMGDTTWCKGKVLRKYREGQENLVECEIWCEDQRGRTTGLGQAVASLPSRIGGPIVLPVVKVPKE